MELEEKYENEDYWEFYSVCSIKMTKFGAGSLTFTFWLFHLLLTLWPLASHLISKSLVSLSSGNNKNLYVYTDKIKY